MQPSHSKKLEQAQSGTARAALLGVSDGLVTNVSLILGVAAAGAPSNLVRIAGSASLVAGAFSMAVGEFISMRGQAELLASVLETEREQLHSDPKVAHEALEGMLISDGVSPRTAHNAAREIGRDPEKATAMYARSKLGINPNELGAAWGSAVSSLFMFSIGALIPLAPWFFANGDYAVLISLGMSAVAALAIGSYLGYSTNGRVIHAALRQLIVLVLGAGATYLIGRLFHTSVT